MLMRHNPLTYIEIRMTDFGITTETVQVALREEFSARDVESAIKFLEILLDITDLQEKVTLSGEVSIERH